MMRSIGMRMLVGFTLLVGACGKDDHTAGKPDAGAALDGGSGGKGGKGPRRKDAGLDSDAGLQCPARVPQNFDVCEAPGLTCSYENAELNHEGTIIPGDFCCRCWACTGQVFFLCLSPAFSTGDCPPTKPIEGKACTQLNASCHYCGDSPALFDCQGDSPETATWMLRNPGC